MSSSKKNKDSKSNKSKVKIKSTDKASEQKIINDEPVEAAPKEKLSPIEDELAKWKNDYLYLKAEFENYKKQMIKERSELVKYGAERLILAILDILDIFDRSLETEVTPENVSDFVSGVRLTSEELTNTLARFGVSGINPKGQTFDPTLHEALSSEESHTVPPGHITQVFKRAYKLHDRVIRPAQVVVARKPSNNDSFKSEND